MVCGCCIRVLRMELEQIGVLVKNIKLGEVVIEYDPDSLNKNVIKKTLTENGFTLIVNKEEIIVEQIKKAVIDLVHHTTYNAMVRNSDYLVEKFGKTYQYLSSLFSEKEGITLEKYIILQRIEKAKSLIAEDELTLSEIAFIIGYSSVQYLSTQFKNITGVSVTEFKQNQSKFRKPVTGLFKNKT